MVGRVAKGASAAKKLKVAVENVLGPVAGVRLWSNFLRLEITGVSIDDGRTDVLDGLEREGVQLDGLKVNWLNPARNGVQTVSVDVPEHEALKILKKGRIRVGLVFCRVRL